MNKLIITIVATLLLAVSGIALAQDFSGEPGRKGSRNHRGMQPMPLTDQLMRAIKHLDLSEEQKTNIKAVMQGLKEEVHPIMQDMRTGHEQLKELVKAEGYDEDAVALVAEKEGDLAAQRIMLTSEALSNVLAQLTDEQREQLDTMAAERKERARNHQEQRGGKNKPRSQG
jgi:protein CpxP